MVETKRNKLRCVFYKTLAYNRGNQHRTLGRIYPNCKTLELVTMVPPYGCNSDTHHSSRGKEIPPL